MYDLFDESNDEYMKTSVNSNYSPPKISICVEKCKYGTKCKFGNKCKFKH